MRTKKLIPVNDFCINHQIDTSFIDSLRDTGLIEIKTLKKNLFFDAGQLQQLEKIICLHYEWNINIEGIDSISHLLQKIEYLQDEILNLKNKLRFYEAT
ncbi:MAG: chaperone modulator CbpM [Bacteroidales bacterium]|nr:chaperone modulator CbpM [Bacteroidales bacterium]